MDSSQTAPRNIDEYIAYFPPDVQEILQKIRLTIRKAAPKAEETIKYRMPTFTLNGNLVHFAPFKKHIGFYPTPTGTKEFQKELSIYKGAKGSVQLPLDQRIPYGLISRNREVQGKGKPGKSRSQRERANLQKSEGVKNLLLANKVAVIYGAGRPIGGAVARAFAREGARVLLAKGF